MRAVFVLILGGAIFLGYTLIMEGLRLAHEYLKSL